VHAVTPPALDWRTPLLDIAGLARDAAEALDGDDRRAAAAVLEDMDLRIAAVRKVLWRLDGWERKQSFDGATVVGL